MSAAAARAVLQFLDEQNLVTAGADGFRDWTPSDPDTLTAVMGMGGTPFYALEHGPGYVTGNIQIQTRAGPRDYATAENMAMDVFHKLADLTSYVPSPLHHVAEILSVTATDVPQLMDRDELERPVFLAVYQVTYLPQGP